MTAPDRAEYLRDLTGQAPDTNVEVEFKTEEPGVWKDPWANRKFSMRCASCMHFVPKGSDKRAIDEGYVSVTPLALEPTAADDLGMAAYVAGPRAEGAV